MTTEAWKLKRQQQIAALKEEFAKLNLSGTKEQMIEEIEADYERKIETLRSGLAAGNISKEDYETAWLDAGDFCNWAQATIDGLK